MNTVYTEIFKEPDINKKEILRYMSCHCGSEQVEELAEKSLAEVRDKLVYKVCHTALPVKADGSRIILPCGEITSKNLAKNLCGCDEAVVFAATIGVGIDRMISKYSRLSPSAALAFQAIGAERVEALCDEFCRQTEEKLKKDGLKLRPRFSPGYGDLPLETQKMIFSLLDCPKRIGVSLGSSLLMSPSKSVTAFAGIIKEDLSR